jgi:hypothetical protein
VRAAQAPRRSDPTISRLGWLDQSKMNELINNLSQLVRQSAIRREVELRCDLGGQGRKVSRPRLEAHHHDGRDWLELMCVAAGLIKYNPFVAPPAPGEGTEWVQRPNQFRISGSGIDVELFQEVDDTEIGGPGHFRITGLDIAADEWIARRLHGIEERGSEHRLV